MGIVGNVGSEAAEAAAKEAVQAAVKGGLRESIKNGAKAALKHSATREGNAIAGTAIKNLLWTAAKHPIAAGMAYLDYKNDFGASKRVLGFLGLLSDGEDPAKIEYVLDEAGKVVALVTARDGAVTSRNTGLTPEQFEAEQQRTTAAAPAAGAATPAAKDKGMFDTILRTFGMDDLADKIADPTSAMGKMFGMVEGLAGKLFSGNGGLIAGGLLASLFGGTIAGAIPGPAAGIIGALLPIGGLVVAALGAINMFAGSRSSDTPPASRNVIPAPVQQLQRQVDEPAAVRGAAPAAGVDLDDLVREGGTLPSGTTGGTTPDEVPAPRGTNGHVASHGDPARPTPATRGHTS